MSDPAIEAAHRAGGGWYSAREMEAAREALKPIREKHYAVQYINHTKCCVSCWNCKGQPYAWPCPTARLVYSTEELER